jgi:hypothetical protein
MKVSECTLKTRVALVTMGNNRYDTTSAKYGHIAGLVSLHASVGDVVIVEWDNGHIDKVAVKSLVLETKAKEEIAAREVEKQKLEEDFEKVRLQVDAKILVASLAVAEASKIARAAKLDLQDDFADEVSELESAMGRAGWSTSSWHC